MDSDVAREGDNTSALFTSTYAELREMAHRFFDKQPSAQTLQATELVHEVFVRIASTDTAITNQEHLANLCARAMRQVLVDHARQRIARRQREHTHQTERHANSGPSDEDIIAINDALDRYHEIDSQRTALVQLRIFGGFTLEQSAEFLGIARSTASEHWRVARAWLTGEIRQGHRSQEQRTSWSYFWYPLIRASLAGASAEEDEYVARSLQVGGAAFPCHRG
ncbi:hypothetical protein JYS44_00590 [Phycisphaeraceae bacterium AH-315-B13]|nr:hypothetical protein [Phycisphaeraceae bacterium AH-315-B13]PHQ79232.1 MAG: hypothetical protein COB69_08375 [Phycisphaera sp.]